MAESKDAEANETVMRDLQNQIKAAKISLPELSTIAQQGDEKLVEKFLSESIEVDGDKEEVKKSQLYIASFWGFPDVVKVLISNGVDVNYQNKGTLWTPLHAAAFQEHGKVVMILLENGAQPELPDSDGRTATDFASASEKIWAHFATMGCPRTSKKELIDKGIIKKVAPASAKQGRRTPQGSAGVRLAACSRPESAYAIRADPGFSKHRSNDSSQMSAVLGGDILAGEPDNSERPDLAQAQDPKFSLWRT